MNKSIVAISLLIVFGLNCAMPRHIQCLEYIENYGNSEINFEAMTWKIHSPSVFYIHEIDINKQRLVLAIPETEGVTQNIITNTQNNKKVLELDYSKSFGHPGLGGFYHNLVDISSSQIPKQYDSTNDTDAINNYIVDDVQWMVNNGYIPSGTSVEKITMTSSGKPTLKGYIINNGITSYKFIIVACVIVNTNLKRYIITLRSHSKDSENEAGKILKMAIDNIQLP